MSHGAEYYREPARATIRRLYERETGAPDLVIEIGSPNTRSRDETIK